MQLLDMAVISLFSVASYELTKLLVREYKAVRAISAELERRKQSNFQRALERARAIHMCSGAPTKKIVRPVSNESLMSTLGRSGTTLDFPAVW
jgi:hypothetical protein